MPFTRANEDCLQQDCIFHRGGADTVLYRQRGRKAVKPPRSLNFPSNNQRPDVTGHSHQKILVYPDLALPNPPTVDHRLVREVAASSTHSATTHRKLSCRSNLPFCPRSGPLSTIQPRSTLEDPPSDLNKDPKRLICSWGMPSSVPHLLWMLP